MVTIRTSPPIRVVAKTHGDRQMRTAARSWSFLSPRKLKLLLDREANILQFAADRIEMDADLKVFTDWILTMIGGLSA